MAQFDFYSREHGTGKGDYFLYTATAKYGVGFTVETIVTLWPEVKEAKICWDIQGPKDFQAESPDLDILWETALGLLWVTQGEIDDLVEEYRILDSEPND